MRRFKICASICVAVVFAAGFASAAWIEIDDFEDGFGFTGTPVILEDENATPPTNNGWQVAGTLTTSSRQIITDPDGLHPNNEVLAIVGGASLGIAKPGSVSVPDGATATVFLRYRFLSTTSTTKPSVGFSLNDAGVATAASGPYFQVGDNATASLYRLQSYNPAAAPITDVDADAWYSVWMVVNNNPTPATDTVNFYMRRDDGTGPFATQTQLTWDNAGTPSNTFTFRSDKAATLTNFFFRTNGNHSGSRTVYFDDVFYDTTGVVLTSPLPTLHAGDFDGDGDVDGADFVAWQTNFPKETGATLAQGDADGDGDVDGADFVVWQTNFPFPSAPGASIVPEPTALVLGTLGAAMISILTTRSRRNLSCHDMR
jgi:hypothetical protein